ncbi:MULTISPECIES: hypothetical protein [unclassified Microcoleus]|uniref:hypothetical protein n=1 Tax=unclassified Microcoleus TaxID=2642155 RepID=UPI002FD4C6F8
MFFLHTPDRIDRLAAVVLKLMNPKPLRYWLTAATVPHSIGKCCKFRAIADGSAAEIGETDR